MEGFDFGKAAEWARKVAQKFEKNGRLLLMAAMFGPSGHFCSRVRIQEVGGRRRCRQAQMRARCVLRRQQTSLLQQDVEETKCAVSQGAKSIMYEQRITTKCGQKRIQSASRIEMVLLRDEGFALPGFSRVPFSFTMTPRWL
jgi:hypothetical protein